MEGTSNDPTENLKKKPRKGILKTSSSFESKEQTVPAAIQRKERKEKQQKETKWDEMNILETLHPVGKDYGHMKIEEPKTPYERSIPDDTPDSVDPELLTSKLIENASKPMKYTTLSSSESDEEETQEDRERRKSFEQKRKEHYNEFFLAKRAMAELMEEDDDEEEEEETKVDAEAKVADADKEGAAASSSKKGRPKKHCRPQPYQQCKKCMRKERKPPPQS